MQVRMPDETWKWVKLYPGSITVNSTDALQFWAIGYLKSSVHRVVVPPDDQAHIDILSLLYLLRPTHGFDLRTLDRPLLKKLGLKGDKGEAAGIKAGDWVRARMKGNLDKAEGERAKKEGSSERRECKVLLMMA
ncbi:hypothetical protein K469DRAFT_689555 [Zopfia rhizophila CBS 207.26]|uniref:Isopenicillin N synthase-like Fe(2+) 2OG dioxygenase domain-containing protein n=1 Tax=Zopfia rhizophila CBS 207.26 TaxID=1314779 RepID=A0A6A6DVU3_9PEZI|nr:hypothetical protein K469DRAFT_689555 [Zopfia rhizophila CBS 207.26]